MKGVRTHTRTAIRFGWYERLKCTSCSSLQEQLTKLRRPVRLLLLLHL